MATRWKNDMLGHTKATNNIKRHSFGLSWMSSIISMMYIGSKTAPVSKSLMDELTKPSLIVV